MNPCDQLDEFFDGELDAAAAKAFRDHLATCDRCQAALRGRMQEAMVADEAQPVVLALPVRRTRYYAAIGAAVALAAAVALVWQLKKPAPPVQVAELGATWKIEQGKTKMRGESAHVGDTAHITAVGQLWIYRGDHELLLVCPGGAGCRASGADLDLKVMGTYQLVSIAPTTIVPRGDFDTDVAAVANANVKYKVDTLEVQ